MRLRDLDAEFICSGLFNSEVSGFHRVETMTEAQGIIFLCPKCFAANGGRVGTHAVICWSRSRGAPEDFSPLPGRWALAGTGIDDLSLNVDSGCEKDSVQLIGGCNAHYLVKNGDVKLC